MRSNAFLISCLLMLAANAALAQRSPLVAGGREVTGLMVTAPIRVGSPLPAGLPTVPLYTVRPGHFTPVREDYMGVYFQAEGAFAEGGSGPGGLFISRESLAFISTYTGNGRYPKMYLPFVGRVQPTDLSKVRLQFSTEIGEWT